MEATMVIEAIYPCWSYVLSRVGKRELLTMIWINEIMPTLLIPFETDGKANKGDILVWKTELEEPFDAPLEILANGIILSRRVKYQYHAGICEGNNLVSDMTNLIDGDFPLAIRMRRISDLTVPSFFIPYEVFTRAEK